MPSFSRLSFHPSALLIGALMVTPQWIRASGYEFEGIGTRQVSRAGAATADADDWSAFYWNPARMTDVASEGRKEFGIEMFGGKAEAKDGNSLSTLPGIGTNLQFDRQQLNSPFLLGAAGVVRPAGETWAWGGGFYTPLLQGLEFDDTAPATASTIEYTGSAGILVGNISAARKITDRFSIGGGINLLYGQIQSETHISALGGFLVSDGRVKGDGTALEGVVSAEFKANDQWRFGGVYRSGGDIDIKGDSWASVNGVTSNSDFRFSLRHPPTASLGSAYSPTPQTTWTSDVAWTAWHRFSSEIIYDHQSAQQQNVANSFDWRNTWKIKAGVKHSLSDVNQIYAGYSYDRPSLDAGSIDFSATVDVPMHRVSSGFAHKWSDGFETSTGFIWGKGSRQEAGVRYKLTGWQIMTEMRFIY